MSWDTITNNLGNTPVSNRPLLIKVGGSRRVVHKSNARYHIYSPNDVEYFVLNSKEFEEFCKKRGFSFNYFRSVVRGTAKLRDGRVINSCYDGWHGFFEGITGEVCY